MLERLKTFARAKREQTTALLSQRKSSPSLYIEAPYYPIPGPTDVEPEIISLPPTRFMTSGTNGTNNHYEQRSVPYNIRSYESPEGWAFFSSFNTEEAQAKIIRDNNMRYQRYRPLSERFQDIKNKFNPRRIGSKTRMGIAAGAIAGAAIFAVGHRNGTDNGMHNDLPRPTTAEEAAPVLNNYPMISAFQESSPIQQRVGEPGIYEEPGMPVIASTADMAQITTPQSETDVPQTEEAVSVPQPTYEKITIKPGDSPANILLRYHPEWTDSHGKILPEKFSDFEQELGKTLITNRDTWQNDNLRFYQELDTIRQDAQAEITADQVDDAFKNANGNGTLKYNFLVRLDTSALIQTS